METALKIRGCILGDGRSIRAVARETGISRTTIKKYLKDPEQPQYRERQLRVGHKLNAQFEARLREFFKHDLVRGDLDLQGRDLPLSAAGAAHTRGDHGWGRVPGWHGAFADMGR